MYGDCPYDAELRDDVMTNMDHTIDQEIAAELKVSEAWAAYSGWNFNGAVWWDRDADTYKCQVWRFHIPGIIVSGSLEDIMEMVSADFGSD